MIVERLPEPPILVVMVLLFWAVRDFPTPGLVAAPAPPPVLLGAPEGSRAVIFWFLRADERELEVVETPPWASLAVFSLMVAESTVFCRRKLLVPAWFCALVDTGVVPPPRIVSPPEDALREEGLELVAETERWTPR